MSSMNGREIRLCDHHSTALSVTVWAAVKAGKLTISGQDMGTTVEGWFGDADYEYWYSFDESNTQRLLALLSKGGKDPFETMSSRFSGLDGCEKLRFFCQENGVTYQFDSWV